MDPVEDLDPVNKEDLAPVIEVALKGGAGDVTPVLCRPVEPAKADPLSPDHKKRRLDDDEASAASEEAKQPVSNSNFHDFQLYDANGKPSWALLTLKTLDS